jgi:lipopolysaccharide biosynthesis glycosyltransferase
MADEVMHVAVATDDAFALPTAVTLRSLLTAAEGTRYAIAVLHGGVSEATQEQIAKSLPEGRSTLQWLHVDGTLLESLPTGHLSLAAYYRLMIPEVLPDVDRVLYADSDVLFRGSVAPLQHVELGTHLVAAVRSVNFPSLCTWGAMDHWRELGLSPRAPYFNSGLMVIDVHGWQRESVGARVIDFVRSEFVHGTNFDQQALNAILSGCWLELPPIWNLQTPLLDDRRGGHLLYDDAEIERARRDPVVVHFMDRPKPWHRDCVHPFREDWRRVASDTAFAPIELDTTSPLTSARWRVKRAAAALIRGV